MRRNSANRSAYALTTKALEFRTRPQIGERAISNLLPMCFTAEITVCAVSMQ
jgi:hypothetical protein